MSTVTKRAYLKVLAGGGGTFMKHIGMFRAALAAFVIVVLTGQSLAVDIFVSPTGSGDFSGSSWSNAINGNEEKLLGIKVKSAITDAIAGASEEVNVYFASGEYVTTNQITLSSITIPVKLSGGYVGETDGSFDRSKTATTFKRSTYNIRFIYATSLSSFIVEGITFSGGYVSGVGAKGGALYSNSSSTIIKSCEFKGNSFQVGAKGSNKSDFEYWSGGGAVAAVNGGNAIIIDCLFDSNYHANGGSHNHSLGGAVVGYNIDMEIKNCSFNNNYMDGKDSYNTTFGAAIGTYGGNLSINNCTFFGNYIKGAMYSQGCGSGGALAIRNPKTFRMKDSILEKNYVANSSSRRADYLGGIAVFDDWKSSDGTSLFVIERCTFDSRNVPTGNLTSSKGNTKLYVQSDILLSGGTLCMTNNLIFATRGGDQNSDRAIRCMSSASTSKSYRGYFYSTWASAPTSMELVNCTIADGKLYGAAAQTDDAELILKNCIVSGYSLTGVVNAASIEHSYIQANNDGTWNYEGAGNLNPNQVGDINWTGAPYYHLLTKNADGAITNGWFSGTFESPKCAADSPCIDAGAPGSLGLDLEPYYSGRRVNIGAYGGTPWASKTSPLPGFKLIVR